MKTLKLKSSAIFSFILLFFIISLTSCNKESMKAVECSPFSGRSFKKNTRYLNYSHLSEASPKSRTISFKKINRRSTSISKQNKQEIIEGKEVGQHSTVASIRSTQAKEVVLSSKQIPAREISSSPIIKYDEMISKKVGEVHETALLASTSKGHTDVANDVTTRGKHEFLRNFYKKFRDKSSLEDQSGSVPAKRKNGSAIAALILGLLFVIFAIATGVGIALGLSSVIGYILLGLAFGSGISAFVLGLLGLKKSKRDGSPHKGMAVVGIVLGSLALFGVLFLIMAGIGAAVNPNG